MSSHRKNHIPKVKSKVPPSIDTTAIGSDPSLRETAVSLLSGGPRRSEPAEPETFAIPPNRRYSKLATEEIKSKKGELNEKLKVAEQRSVPLCMRSRADVSDSHPNGPWARKAILSFDGGGVKGFSSLLIIKRLTSLIEEIETGQRRCNLPDSEPQYYEAHGSSEDCPWNPQDPRQPPEMVKIIDEEDGHIRAAVQRCLSTRQSDRFKIHHFVDYIAGTSTGGLSAIMLGRLEMSVQAALDQYDIVGNEVFGRPRFIHSTIRFANYVRPKYKSKRMEHALISVVRNGLKEELKISKKDEHEQRKYASEAPFQSDPRRCRVILLAHGPSGQNRDVHHTYMFRSYDHAHPSPWAPEYRRKLHLNPGPATSHEIWKVARATSAAPKYFSPISFDDRTFRDGAIGANNPAKVALDEVLQMHRYPPRLLITIGTGLQRYKARIRNPEKLRKAKGWRNLAKVLTQLISQSEATADIVFETCENEDVEHVRWNPPGVGDIGLDEWEPATNGKNTKDKMTEMTIEYLSKRDVHLRLVQFARELVALRRARAETERWEVFARKFLYFCPEPACHHLKATQTFLTRDELRDHGIHEHSYIINVEVEGDNSEHACTFDKCGLGTISIFQPGEEFTEHLRTRHDVKDPMFMTPRRMEAWLDLGRMTQQEAVQRHDSYEESIESQEMGGILLSRSRTKNLLNRPMSWRSMKPPPEMIVEDAEHSPLSTPLKAAGSQNGDEPDRSFTLTPSPARSHTTAGESEEAPNRKDSTEMIQVIQAHAAVNNNIRKARSSRWQTPISIMLKRPWKPEGGFG